MELMDTTRRRLRRTVLDKQRTGRVPGVAAGVVRHGELVWHDGVGAADVARPDVAPGRDDQFLVASISKTFTAVMIMQLRDEGRLSLDDRLDRHLPGSPHGEVTLRQMLSHTSGIQREPVGDVWETLVWPDREQLVAGFAKAERVMAPHQRFHYSNLMYSLLGEVIARADGLEWGETLQRRLLDPLGMRRTTVGFDGARVRAYFVPPHTDVPVPEPDVDLGAMNACGGLASTLDDLATWSGFVADPPAEILSPDTLEEMCQPQIMIDVERWVGAMGLGFFLVRRGTRVYVGHTGGMPGQITGVFTDRESGTGGVVLMNSSVSPDPAGFAIDLADLVVEDDPEEPEAWRPGTEVPDELVPLLGTWYSEGSPLVFSVRDGQLEARSPDLPAHKPASVFEKVGDDVYRTVTGRERGELLRVTRREDGTVHKLSWATYLVSREPLAFGQEPS
ncbi:serine hydrolase domain-containing protein [Nocardioides rubriscoriae]|uniref:serine hydrolase domain-containing protein n=1 Tax=Nocardioides rubriscoriae TaxID=642762 RepID=UPI0011DFF2CE|nr:serine hydrolase domain-containing protein [Nocardioides rubriscoriae]